MFRDPARRWDTLHSILIWFAEAFVILQLCWTPKTFSGAKDSGTALACVTTIISVEWHSLCAIEKPSSLNVDLKANIEPSLLHCFDNTPTDNRTESPAVADADANEAPDAKANEPKDPA